MNHSTTNMPELSGPAKAGVAVLVIGAAGSAVWFFRNDLTAMLIALGGMVGVILLLLAYRWAVGAANRRKARPMERAILAHTAVAPRQVSAPARRAALDDLRKKFQSGIEKFRAAGKDLYTLPWYVLVGEPGGGKTEAIRHCNVGFPPGLQEYTQGTGGTINMNWWFTNHAIILDTAGRLMFEEVAPGTTSEWQEFLRLLTKVRPNCPINGMLLVIPADTLIRDSADTIEQKAGRIATQLDEIQRELGVRFPVFVIVTKCDLITGFREFFENINDPQLQHQILGWSNPAPLDKAFDPDQLDKHMENVRKRLIRRRNLLLADPVHTEDPNLRRMDQVDALFSFPDSFSRVIPRLKRYLELIFAASEWSPKPLFLRGIYFTSSMREGQVLDRELADALGVPIDSLKEDGKLWERERAYFLRDLFMAKVFREKGLVTRSSNTRRAQRRMKAAVLTLGLVGLGALLALTWIGSQQLRRSVGRQANYWMAVSAHWSDRRPEWRIVRPAGENAWVYNGALELNLGEGKTTLGEFFGDAAARVDEPLEVPLIFRPQALVRGDLNEQKRQAYRGLYETAVLAALADATRTRLQRETPDTWTNAATEALGQLLRIEVQQAGLTPGGRAVKPSESLVSLDKLFRYVLDDQEYNRYRSHLGQSLQDTLTWLYDMGDAAWPPAALATASDVSRRALTGATDAFALYAQGLAQGQSDRIRDLVALRQALERFQRAEEALWQATGASPGADATPQQARQAYLSAVEPVRQAGALIGQITARLEQDWPADMSLLNLYEREYDRAVEGAIRAHELLLEQIPQDASRLPPHLASARQALVRSLEQVQQGRQTLPEGLQNDLSRLDRLYLSRTPDVEGRPARRFQVHLRIYEMGAQELTSGAPAPGGTITRTLNDLGANDNGPAGDRLRLAIKAVRSAVE